MAVQVKICGIKAPDTLNAAIVEGARFIGFVFYPPSPRHIDIDTSKELILKLPTGVRSVGLFVDPTDEQLDNVLAHSPLDMIQLHGHETVMRTEQIKQKYALPIIKAFHVANVKDIEKAKSYENIVDWLLFDSPTGGSGQSFDWKLLKGIEFSKPWMLSGGLTTENVKQALEVLSPNAMDVSSGVETRRGVKCPNKIKQFIKSCRYS